MKVAVNTRLLLKDRLEGMGRFTHEVLHRLVLLMPDVEFTFLFDREYDQQFIYGDNVTAQVLGPQARHPFLYHLWFEYAIPKYLAQHPHDLLLSTDGYLSLKAPIKKINVMHDINFEHIPGMVTGLHKWHYCKYFPRYARHADRLLTVSEYSRFDIARTYGIPEENIEVMYNGVSDIFSPTSDADKMDVRKEVADGSDYFVFVGSMNPRKNLAFLLEAFDRFLTETGEDMKLVLVGSSQRWYPEAERVYKGMTHASKVVFTGRLDDHELVRVLSAAVALTFVPLFEGFGIPIIEAFACGVPVIASNVSSLPEIAEEAALYVNPYEVDELVGAMKEIHQEAPTRRRLIAAGLRRKDKFNWHDSAEKLENIIRQVLHG